MGEWRPHVGPGQVIHTLHFDGVTFVGAVHVGAMYQWQPQSQFITQITAKHELTEYMQHEILAWLHLSQHCTWYTFLKRCQMQLLHRRQVLQGLLLQKIQQWERASCQQQQQKLRSHGSIAAPPFKTELSAWAYFQLSNQKLRVWDTKWNYLSRIVVRQLDRCHKLCGWQDIQDSQGRRDLQI